MADVTSSKQYLFCREFLIYGTDGQGILLVGNLSDLMDSLTFFP